jgi:RNA polymerase sigma-70 factor (ECF subfamily)
VSAAPGQKDAPREGPSADASEEGPTEARGPGHDSSVDAALSHASFATPYGADDPYPGDGPPADGLALREGGSGAHLRFDAVYDEWFDFVWRSARRLGVHDASLDDVAQDVFLVVYRRLSEFEGRSTLKTWLFGITLRVVSDWRRTKRRKGGLSELPPEDALACARSGPADELERAESARLLASMLAELDDDKRTVFVMIELEELTAPEVASLLGVPLNTVYSRLRVAREEFERALARYRAKERSGGERARARRQSP